MDNGYGLPTCVRDRVLVDLGGGLQGHRVARVAHEARLPRVAHEPGGTELPERVTTVKHT